MTVLLAIDPGPDQSAFVRYDLETRAPVEWAKLPNDTLLTAIGAMEADELAIEMIASYGMPVGAETFDTCVWIGRMIERWAAPGWMLVYRREVKLHLCGNVRAKDGNVRQALIDRYDGKALAVGRKASPGPLYGISGDVWAALGVAITADETRVA